MALLVPFEGTRSAKSGAAFITFIGSLQRMDSLVYDETPFLAEVLFTLVTFEGFFAGMRQAMSLKI